MTSSYAQFAEQGKQAFQEKRFAEAARLFEQAAAGYHADGDRLTAAEMQNNASVALLQEGRAAESLEAALDTDKVFAEAGDFKRQGMALGNQAAALEALRRFEEAAHKYDLAARLFEQAGEGDLRALVMKSSAAVKLRGGDVTASAFKLIGWLDAKPNPNFFERILKFLMRFLK